MCGIAGIIHFDNELVNPEVLQEMSCAISHRGPDANGTYINKEVGLTHRRLSIIDLNQASNQPFADIDQRYTLVFNGEMYNYQDVKNQLSEYPFRTNSDTEVLLAAYSKWGIACLDKFSGMFAFVIWDNKEKKLTVVRDRLGVKPVYYILSDRFFAFASEQRALLKSGMTSRQLNKQAILQYLLYQSVPSPFSITEGIEQLEAGCYLIVERGTLSKHRYWSLAESVKPLSNVGNADTIYKNVRTLLRNAVSQRLVSDVPVGALLSGGIDSSVIVGLMAEASVERPNTFTVGFEEKEFDESDYAATVSKRFNTRHTNIRLKPSVFLDELQESLNAMDSPSGDGINTYVVSKAIKNAGITVALSGVGGDELFAGYPFFKQFLAYKKYQGVWTVSSFLRKTIGHLADLSKSAKAERFKQLLLADACSIQNFYPVIRQITTLNRLRKTVSFANGHLPEFQIQQLNGYIQNLPLLSQVSVAEFNGYTQNTLLKDMDQMSMAVALELREPYFDHELVSYVLSVPDRFKYPDYPKKLLIESVKDLLPLEIVFRKKQGFLFPWKHWLKNELHSFCNHYIHLLAERDFINKKVLLKKWEDFSNDKGMINWMEIWLLVVLEYWIEKNVEG